MGRKNHRGSMGQRSKRQRAFAEVPHRPPAMARRPAEQMPLAKIAGRCPGPKRRMRYETKPDAEQALAIVRRERLAKGHAEAAIEKRVYRCEITGCGGWHLTSRTEYTPIPRRPVS